MQRHITAATALLAAAYSFWLPPLLHAAPPAPLPSLRSNVAVELQLKTSAAVTGNLLRLGDLVDLPEPTDYWQRQLQQPLAPTPRADEVQRWSAEQIGKLLTLRGLAPESYSIAGAEACEVRRREVLSASGSTAANFSPATAQAVSPASFTAVNRGQASDQTARRNAQDAIQQYLAVTAGDAEGYEISVDVPAEATAHLLSRRNIRGVSGGQPPWDGPQRFTLQVEDRGIGYEIECVAQLEPPRMIYAAATSLSREHVLTADDVKLVPMPRERGGESGMEDIAAMLGKQLIRSLATGQVIQPDHLRTPRLIDSNDAVEIQVHAGGLVVTSTGRALQGGGIDDIIAVEVLPHRSKILARVRSPGVVAVISTP